MVSRLGEISSFVAIRQGGQDMNINFVGPFSAVRAVSALLLDRVVAPPPANPVSDEASDGASVDSIDAYIGRHLDRLNVPGAALAIVEGDRIVHLHGFGRARPGGEPPSPQTPFIVGSLTKSFTALAVMQLVEAGKIELDAPVQRYLPWFRVADPDASTHMTVRHLLNQTSGLPQLPGVLLLADLDQSPDARERQARALATLKLTRPPGSAWEYSNLNYNLLGLIIEAVSGTSYETYIQDHIFSPLDMRHSFTSRADVERDGLAMGHRYWFAVPIATPGLPVPRGSLASGQLISSAADMAQYLITHLNGGRYRDAQILSREGIDALHRPAAPIEIMGKPDGEYAMGWIVEDIGERKVLWHDGVVPDFYSYMALVPERKRGVVLLVNANHMLMTFALREVGGGVGRLLAGYQPNPIRLGVIPWVLRGLPLIPLLQLVGAATTLRRVQHWRRDPMSRPRHGCTWVRDFLLPLIPNLLLALPLLVMQRHGMRRMLLLFLPDVSWTALICSSLAVVWSFVRTGLFLRSTGKPHVSRGAGSAR
jgi:CubicO group peptidase (beta-lactamase class C family)